MDNTKYGIWTDGTKQTFLNLHWKAFQRCNEKLFIERLINDFCIPINDQKSL